MEVRSYPIRKGLVQLAFAVTIGFVFHSCRSQLGVAQEVHYDTVVVPKPYRPIPLQVKPQEQPKRQVNPQTAKDFQEIMNLVRKADKKIDKLDNIEAVNRTLLDIANNMIAMQNRFRGLSITKDSIISAQANDLRAYKEDSRRWRELLSETERRRLEDRKESVEANRLKKAQENLTQVGGIGTVILILLSIIGSNWLSRKKIEYKISQISKQPQ